MKLLSSIPNAVTNAVAFEDRLSGVWRYEFGDPINDFGAIGSHTFPTVELLFKAIKIARDRLTNKDFLKWLSQLFNQSQHLSRLEEIAPIFRLQDDVGVIPDVDGPKGNVDWEILVPSLPSIFLEVKLRHVDLADTFDQVRAGRTGQELSPKYDISFLFVNLEHKFAACNPTERLQGIWIAIWIKQERSELQAAFARLNPSKIHFALIVPQGGSGDSAFLLAQPGVRGEQVLNVFGLKHDSTMMFDRNG